jgi:hypothetical protein
MLVCGMKINLDACAITLKPIIHTAIINGRIVSVLNR